MRTVVDTPRTLELRSDVSTQRIVCGVMVVLGLAIFGVQLLPDAEPSLVAYVLGGLMAIFGSAGVVFLRSDLLRVDLDAGRVEVQASSLHASRRHAVRIGDISDVALEESIDGDGDASFRVSFIMRDGRRLPVSSTYSPDFAGTATVADLVRRRLFPDASPRPRPRGHVIPARALRRETRLIFALLVVMCGFLAAGVHLASKEQRSLRHFQPVTVTVFEVKVDAKLGDEGGMVRRPSITYRYEVNGVPYTSDRVTPLDEWRAGSWARDIAARFTVGERYEGWYDPVDPSSAYLLRRRSAMPLLLIAVPLFGVLILSFGGLQRARG